MVTVTILWHDGGRTEVSGRTVTDALMRADSMGATNVRTSTGERYFRVHPGQDRGGRVQIN